MRRSSFAQAAVQDGAAALNRVFNEYLVPITFSSEQLHLHMSYNDVDATASPIWYDDEGTVLAAALLAIRARRGWIGGFGVAPNYRRQGYARTLLEYLVETARARGIQSLQLEVLRENEPAIGVYQRGGFRIGRELRSFEMLYEDAVVPLGFVFTSPNELIDEPESVRPCWQRERATLRNGAVSAGVTDENSNFALFRFNTDIAQVLKLGAKSAGDLLHVGQAVASGHHFQNVLLLNEPHESPIAEFAREAGWDEPFVQYEMVLEL